MENFHLKDMQAIASKSNKNNVNCSYSSIMIRNSEFYEAFKCNQLVNFTTNKISTHIVHVLFTQIDISEMVFQSGRQHFVEYLGKLVFKHEIDPVSILEQDELEIILRRAGKPLPSRYGITPGIWKDKLLNVIISEY